MAWVLGVLGFQALCKDGGDRSGCLGLRVDRPRALLKALKGAAQRPVLVVRGVLWNGLGFSPFY